MKKIDSIPAAALILASSVLLSRVLGYAREMLLAYKFGASATTDAFYAAFQIPDLLNYFLSGGALSIAFIPLYNKILARDGEDAAQRLVSVVLGTLGAVVVVLTALLWFKADAITRFQFPDFDEATIAQTMHLTRLVLPAQIFFITGGILQAVLLAHRYFTAAALAPLIYNASIIAGGFFLTPVIGIDGFAVGTLVGALIGPFLIPLIQCCRYAPVRPRVAPHDKNFLIYIVMALPLMFGQTLLTLDEWYGRWFGAALGTGAIAHLGYARRLMQVPIAVIGQAVAAAALPTLSKLWAEGREIELNATLQKTLSVSLMLAVLAGGVFVLLAAPIVDILYYHGAFTGEDAVVVSILTAIFSLAIPAWILQQISVRGFYARSDTWRPMIVGTLISAAAIPLYMWMAKNHGTEGLAYAGAIAMTVNAVGTLLAARIWHSAPSMTALFGSLLRAIAMTAPALVAGYAALFWRHEYWPLESASHNMQALADLFIGGIAYKLTGVCGLLLIGGDDVRQTLKNIIRKVLKK